MQVNNNVQTPQSFGMAVKIKPSADGFLNSQSSKTLETLEKLGEEFAGYKFWHLEVDDKGYRVAGEGVLDSAYRHIGRVDDKNVSIYSDSVKVPVTVDKFANKGQSTVKHLSYRDASEAQEALTRLTASTNELDRAAAFIRELETLSARKAYEDAAKATAQEAKANKVSNLMSKYGVVE